MGRHSNQVSHTGQGPVQPLFLNTLGLLSPQDFCTCCSPCVGSSSLKSLPSCLVFICLGLSPNVSSSKRASLTTLAKVGPPHPGTLYSFTFIYFLYKSEFSLSNHFFFFEWERGREGKRGRETMMCKRNMDGLSPMRPQQRTLSATQACAPTGNPTSNLLGCGMMPNPLTYTSQG